MGVPKREFGNEDRKGNEQKGTFLFSRNPPAWGMLTPVCHGSSTADDSVRGKGASIVPTTGVRTEPKGFSPRAFPYFVGGKMLVA
jgi:hypothetical protein